MHTRQSQQVLQEGRNALGQRIVGALSVAAEFANVGILVQALGGWFPAFAAFAEASPLYYVMMIGDRAIYFLRGLIRFCKLTGKKLFNIEFKEEKQGEPHRLQTAGNLAALACFSLAIALFCGALIAPPVGITVAWTLGLLGQSCVSFFDYLWPEKQAWKKHQQLVNSSSATEQEKLAAYKEYEALRTSRRLFMGVLVGLSLLLICGSAVAFAPPLLVPALAWVSNLASLGLGVLAVTRFCRWCREFYEEKTASSKAEPAFISEIELMPLVARSPSLNVAPDLLLEDAHPRPFVRALSPSLPSQAGRFSQKNLEDSSPAQIVAPDYSKVSRSLKG